MKHTLLLFAMALLVVSSAVAQDKNVMMQYQIDLQGLFNRVQNDPTDNERYLANENAIQLFSEALGEPNSHKWNWDFGTYVSVLTAPDKKFRIITWPVLRDNGEMECFGFVQAFNEKTEMYEVYVLNDKSDEIISRDEALLDNENWLGMVYQSLIVTEHEGRTYYTLLGWNGVDNITERKVIEPICFRGGSGKPQFGQALFRKEKNLRRIVIEYTNTAMVNLRYEEQTLRITETKVVKDKKGRRRRVEETHDSKKRMIIFDEVEPQVMGMEGLYQYYVPSGIELGYVFANGKWELYDNAHGRVTNERLNSVDGYEKKTAAYNLKRKEAK